MSIDIAQLRGIIAAFNKGKVSALVVAGYLPELLDAYEQESSELTKVYDKTFNAGEIDAEYSASLKVARIVSSRDHHHGQLRKLRELARKSRESLADYVARLDKAQDFHLSVCPDCNYDHECTACAADYDGDAHNCNCHVMPGYGYQLRKLLEMARDLLRAKP